MAGGKIVPYMVYQFYAIHFRHHQIRHYNVRHPGLGHQLQGFLSVGCIPDLEAVDEIVVHIDPEFGIVLDHKHLDSSFRPCRSDPVLAQPVRFRFRSIRVEFNEFGRFV